MVYEYYTYKVLNTTYRLYLSVFKDRNLICIYSKPQ